MKGKPQPTHYFSAYPLKAIIPPSAVTSGQQQTPYLRSVLSAKKSSGSRLRVLPMANAYATHQNTLPVRVKPAKQVEATGDEWFHHYE